MIPGPKTEEKEQDLLTPDCSRLLEAEIEFWKEVIATAPAKQSAESLERMHQALALAEAKLAQLTAGYDLDSTHFEFDRPRWRQ